MIYKNILLTLNSAYFLRSKISHFPVCQQLKPQPEGLSVVIFETREDANKYLVTRGVKDDTEFNLERVNSIYDRIIDFAKIGYVGIWFYNKFPLFFANRLSEYDCELPTVGYYINEDQNNFINEDQHNKLYIGASGILSGVIAVKPWYNYFRSDKLIRRYYTKYYNELRLDLPLYSLQGETSEWILINESPLHGPYGSGGFALFSSIKEAREAIDILKSNDTGNISIVEIGDHINFLNEQYIEFNAVMDYCLNPFSSRFLQGYFFKFEQKWYLKNIGGIYLLEDKRLYKCKDDDLIEIPKSDAIEISNQLDTIETKVKTTVKFPLKRILKTTKSNLSFREASEVVKNEISNSIYAEREEWDKPIEPEQIGRDNYLVFGFDMISGNPFSNDGLSQTPYVFSDILEACSFFYHRLFQYDLELRINGFGTHSFIKGESKNPEYEKYRFDETRAGLIRLMEDILVAGYRPAFSDMLKKFITESSIVLQIDACGYIEDFSFYENSYIDKYISENTPDKQGRVDDDSPVTQKICKLLKTKKSKPELDYNVQQMIKRWLGKSEAKLDYESKMMLETAIIDFQEKGKSDSVDYAPISMELCKVFERELKRHVFDNWKEKSTDINKNKVKGLEQSTKDETTERFCRWYLGKDKIELGPMRHFIKSVRESTSNWMFAALRTYIKSLPSSEFILSNDFEKLLTRISNDYRNGGVHEHLVKYSICEKAFKEILTGPNNALSRLLSN